MKKLFYAEIDFSESNLEDITSKIIDETIIKEDSKNKYLFYICKLSFLSTSLTRFFYMFYLYLSLCAY